MADILKPMGIVALVDTADWPTDVLGLDASEIHIQPVEDVVLEEAGRYVPIYGRRAFLAQVRVTISPYPHAFTQHALLRWPPPAIMQPYA